MVAYGKNGCVDLGKDFFLIRFNCVDDYDKVLKGGLGLLVAIFWPLDHGNHILKLLKLS